MIVPLHGVLFPEIRLLLFLKVIRGFALNISAKTKCVCVGSGRGGVGKWELIKQVGLLIIVEAG